MALQEQSKAITQVLSKQRKLTPADLQVLRENVAAAGTLSGKSELIDAIASLDYSSTRLGTQIGIWIAGIRAFLAATHLFVGIENLIKH